MTGKLLRKSKLPRLQSSEDFKPLKLQDLRKKLPKRQRKRQRKLRDNWKLKDVLQQIEERKLSYNKDRKLKKKLPEEQLKLKY